MNYLLPSVGLVVVVFRVVGTKLVTAAWKWSRTCYGIASEGGRFSVRLA